ncbi:hypothetical protein GCK32_011728, partial [Trichostrongylus colubriformis]
MNQNLTYTTYTTDPRAPQGQQAMSFHPSSYQSSTYTTSSTAPFHSSSSTAFIPNNTITLQQTPQSSRGGQVTQTQMRLSSDNDEKRISQLLDTYFLDQPASTSTWATPSHQTVQSLFRFSPATHFKGCRYARMTPEERRAHNNRRRMRQMQNALAAVKAAGGTGDPIKDEEAVRAHIKAQNAKKAEAARQRYHRMSEEEKRIYNQRRTEAFRRRRMEEEMLLAMPIGRINGEALDRHKCSIYRAQQIVVRNAKRAEAARLRYQRMTPDQRKSYNQKRYTPKRRRMEGMDSMLSSSGGSLTGSCKKEEDALTAIERDVLKKTQQAQQAIMRQQRQAVQVISQPVATTPTPQGIQGGTYIIQQGSSTPVTHIGQGQVQQIQLASSNGVTHQQVVHTVHQVPVQTIQGQQGPHVTVGQQQVIERSLCSLMPSSSGHLVVQQHVPTTSGGQQLVHQQSAPQQITYTTGGMMVNGQHIQQQIINPYGAPPSRLTL